MTAAHINLAAAEGALKPTGLRCEYRENPLAIDAPQPRLSWSLEAADPAARGLRQIAYQVIASSTEEGLAANRGDLWDSGKVDSDQTIQIAYAGKPLSSGQRVHWKVRAWDQSGTPGAWSPSASWTMGMLKPEDWQARWIGAPREAAGRGGQGYHATEAASADESKWVQVDLGKSLPIESVKLHSLNHPLGIHAVKGFGFPVRFRIEASDDPDFKTAVPIADHSQTDYPNPGYTAPEFKPAGAARGRYVRVTVNKMWKRDTSARPYCFALGQIEVFSGGKNAALYAAVQAKDSIEAWGWHKNLVTDGIGLAGLDINKETYATILLRKELDAPKSVRRAVAYVCGLGQYELTINGQKVGDSVLDPGWTNYGKTCLYDARDVTALLKRGRNALGVMLGNGMYNITGGRYTKFTGSFGPLKAILQLEIEFEDGTTARTATDETWKIAPGPITFSCVFGGEDYDARKEQAGWNRPGFDDSSWKPARAIEGSGGKLAGASQSAPPVKVMKTLIKPFSAREPKPGVYVYDFGQNCSLMPCLVARGAAGATIKITPGELLKPDGTVSQGSSGGPSYFSYTLKGGEDEIWTARFTYYGSRYYQIEGGVPASVSGATAAAGAEPSASGKPVLKELEGLFVSGSSPRVGEFACSNELFNRVNTLINWAIQSNMVSLFTDCPHREKLGWLEQTFLMGPSLMYNFDLAAMFTKMTFDMSESQLDNGLVPDIAPEYVVFNGGFRDSPEWGSAYVIVPWFLYQWYGDAKIIEKHYDGMKKYVAYLGSRAKDNIVSHGLGDWYDIGPKGPGVAQLTPIALTATAFYYHDLTILERAARLLGRADDAARFAALAKEVREAYRRQFFKPETMQFATGSQTANSISIVFGLADAKEAPAVLENVVKDIRSRGNALTAGDVGYRYLLRALAEGGRSDVIFDMNNQSEKPGYGYQLKKGCTSLPEAWDARPGSSQNHFMLGHIMEWFYHDLAGIQCDAAAPAYRKIVIRPQMVGDLTWVNAAYDSMVGRIAVQWKIENGQLSLNASIPPNASATIYVPAKDASSVKESGKPVSESKGVKFLKMDAGAAIYEIASGSYSFSAPR
ncbi:MAG: family 78 glycoside hydrolase catalytic domain [Candidatus Sumerlaeota bacterium]|nr:family 78 glycoside hydrolase catalytic domain [Candidatus Sumerlaeota bacterium]